MRRKLIAIGLLALVMPGLGGCALLGLNKEPRIQAAGTIPVGADAFVQFEAGRASLEHGLYASAIAEFSSARGEPSLLAPSLNGMAVAYANLGRLDLAQRYFRQAIAAAPEDERFTANLARLERTMRRVTDQHEAPIYAARDLVQPMTVLDRGMTTSANPAPARVVVTRPETHLARINQAEVQLSTGVTMVAGDGAGNRVMIEDGQSPASVRAGAAYPIRISLAEVGSASSRVTRGPASPRSYPIRISLAGVDSANVPDGLRQISLRNHVTLPRLLE